MEEIGLFVRNSVIKPVEINDSNRLFFYDKPGWRYKEVIKQGSGKIASLLESDFEVMQALGKKQSKALFDVNGNFLDHLLLLDLKKYEPHIHQPKHIAIFEDCSSDRFEVIALRVDDIHCLGNTAVRAALWCPEDFKHPPVRKPDNDQQNV